MKPLLGLNLQLQHEQRHGLEELSVVVGYRDKSHSQREGKAFLSTPILRKQLTRRIEKGGLQIGEKIGFIQISVHPNGKIMETKGYYPLGNMFRDPRARGWSGKGTAELIEGLCEKMLAQKYPGYRIRSTIFPNPVRIHQLDRRGRNSGEAIPIEEARELSRREAIRQYKKHRTTLRYRVARKLKALRRLLLRV